MQQFLSWEKNLPSFNSAGGRSLTIALLLDLVFSCPQHLDRFLPLWYAFSTSQKLKRMSYNLYSIYLRLNYFLSSGLVFSLT